MPIAQKTELMHRDHVGEIEIAGINYNWAWIPSETEKVIELWHAGWRLDAIAEAVNRYDIEVLVWLNDLYEQGRIEGREGGIFGSGKRD